MPRGIDRDLTRSYCDHAELGGKPQPSQLWDDQQLAVGVVKNAVLHRLGCAVDVDRNSAPRARIAVAAHRDEPVDEIRRFLRER